MGKIVNLMSENPYWVAAGLLATFLGLIISIGALIFQHKRRILSFSQSTVTLIENSISKIKDINIFYKGDKIDSICVTSIHLWNGGNVLLKGSDFYPEHELKININESICLLDVEIVSVSSDTCNFSVEYDTKTVNLGFDFLEKHQGAVIKVYHTYTIC